MSNHCSSLCALADARGDTYMKTKKATYVWTIKNFNFHEALGNDLKSPTFSAINDDKVKWYLLFQFNGNCECIDECSHMSFFVYLSPESELKEVFAEYYIYFLDQALQETPYVHNTEAVNKYIVGTFTNCRWGWERFLKRNRYFKNTLLVDNTLTIKFVIAYSIKESFENVLHECKNSQLYPSVSQCNLSHHFGMLLESHDFADVVLFINDKEYPAHKYILAARSPVFAAMFRHETKENVENRVYIKNVDEEVVSEMLRYIYTGKCENLAELAAGLLAAADKYDLEQLKMICANELYQNLSVENAASVLALANMHCVKELKNAVIKFIVSNSAEVLSTEGWRSIGSNFDLVNEVCLAIARR